MARLASFFKAQSVPFWALITFLILTFATGGASRSDVQSLVVLRPAAVVFCAIGLWTLKWQHVRAFPLLFAMAAAIFALVLSHLIPLPPGIWGALSGRELLTQIDQAAELGAVWRPLSLVPAATWNAFYSLFVPLAVLLLGAQLSREERYKLLPWMLGFGLFSGFFGIMQIVGPTDGPLYLYAVTGLGSANGLFANRNHEALLLACLFPMLAVFAAASARSEEQAEIKFWTAIGIGIILIFLVVVTGSRAGLMLTLLGLLLVRTLYHRSAHLTPKKRSSRTFDLRYGIAFITVVFIGLVSVVMSRGEALQRLMHEDSVNDGRFQIWAPLADMAWKYFPFGSGIGSFVETYQIDEPADLLGPDYYNHAHTDWLETYLTAGLPGLLLMGVAIFAYVRRAYTVFRTPLGQGRGILFARLGAVLLGFFALESLADYPLRVPSLSCLFVIALLWFAGGGSAGVKTAGAV